MVFIIRGLLIFFRSLVNMKIVECRFIFQPVGVLMAFTIVAPQAKYLVSAFGNESQTARKIKRVFFASAEVDKPFSFPITS